MNNLIILMLAAVVVIVILAAVAFYYILRVKKMQAGQRQQEEAAATAREQQRTRLIKSIQIIARGMLDDQLTLTEGSIRIKVMLDGLAVEAEVRDSYSAFYQLAAATDHIPILDAWKKLPTKHKLNFDNQRLQLESDHREFVLDAAQRILQTRW